MIIGIPAHLYFTHFCRSQAGDVDQAEKFYKKAAHMRDTCKRQLAGIVKTTLGNANMSEDVLDNLLQRSKIFKELFAMGMGMVNNDRACEMSAQYNLLTYLGDAT